MNSTVGLYAMKSTVGKQCELEMGMEILLDTLSSVGMVKNKEDKETKPKLKLNVNVNDSKSGRVEE